MNGSMFSIVSSIANNVGSRFLATLAQLEQMDPPAMSPGPDKWRDHLDDLIHVARVFYAAGSNAGASCGGVVDYSYHS